MLSEPAPSFKSPSMVPSLSSSPSFTTTTSSVTATPAQQNQPLPSDRVHRPGFKPRESSETAIFSIYSMYGDGSASFGPAAASHKKVHSATSNIPRVSLTLPDPALTDRASSLLDADSELAYLDRPESSFTERGRASNSHNGNPPATNTATSHSPAPSMNARASTSTSNARSSAAGTPVYHSADSSFSSHHKRSSPPTSTRQMSLPQPATTPDRLSPNAGNQASSSTAILSTYADSPPSKASLVISEGEDVDSFHIRNTYAMLEQSGVKGDGWEEGVERTRARVGPSRSSQLNAMGAIGDGTERARELDEREIAILSSVDRYGFFTITSHDRLVLLNCSPLNRRLSITKPAAPTSASANATPLPALPPTHAPVKEEERIAKWTRMLEPARHDPGHNIEAWSIRSSKEAKFRRRVYKGIPDRWRRAAWDLMLTKYARTDQAQKKTLKTQYEAALERPSSYDIQIDLDVPRTVSGHIMFRTRYGAGQRSLFHGLHCFSLRCEECGYVQGMGPIASTLLCYFDAERTYAALVQLHDAYSLHTIFSPGFPGLLEAIYVQERLTELMMPDVYAAFKTHMVSTTSYATKWYITLFANSVPFQTQLRLWDAFLLEGPDIYVAVALSIVWVYREQLTAASANFETMLSLLSSFFVPEDEDMLLHWIERTLGDAKIRTSMATWRTEWKGLVATGKEGDALL